MKFFKDITRPTQRTPSKLKSVIYNQTDSEKFQCPPFAPIRLYLDLASVYMLERKNEILRKFEDFKHDYFRTNITSKGESRRSENSNLQNFIIVKRRDGKAESLKKILDEISDEYWKNLDFQVLVDEGLSIPEIEVQKSHVPKVEKFIKLTLPKDLTLPSKSLVQIFCSLR